MELLAFLDALDIDRGWDDQRDWRIRSFWLHRDQASPVRRPGDRVQDRSGQAIGVSAQGTGSGSVFLDRKFGCCPVRSLGATEKKSCEGNQDQPTYKTGDHELRGYFAMGAAGHICGLIDPKKSSCNPTMPQKSLCPHEPQAPKSTRRRRRGRWEGPTQALDDSGCLGGFAASRSSSNTRK